MEQIVAPGTNPLADPDPFVVPRFTTMWATSRTGHEGAWGVFEGSGAKRLGLKAAPPPRGAWTRSPSQEPVLLDAFDAEAVERSYTFGAFTWPQTWRLGSGEVSLTTRTLARDALFWWGYGGFAFVVVEGELTIDGEQHEVLGIAEVLEYWR